MKLKLNYKISMVLAMLVAACAEDETASLSRKTTFAKIEIAGGDFEIINVGDIYVEKGAVADEKGAAVDVKIDGEVDTSAPGIYAISYTAINKDGFAKEVFKTVIVAPATVPDEVANTNLEGSYLRNGNPVTVEKVQDGLYYIDNVGGFAPPSADFVSGYFFHTEGETILFPPQPTSVGTVETIESVITGTGFQWIVLGSIFLDNTRSFVKVTQSPVRYDN